LLSGTAGHRNLSIAQPSRWARSIIGTSVDDAYSPTELGLRKLGMAKSRKIIVSCAVTGSVHTPSMSPYLPVTPQQIIEESVAAAEAGAAILHLHARIPRRARRVPKRQSSNSSFPRSSNNAMRW